jgi:molecular chaperone GrpE
MYLPNWVRKILLILGMSQEHSNEQQHEHMNEQTNNSANETHSAENTADMSAETSPETANESVRDFEAELKEKDDKYLRLYAEFENYKRRTSAERIELFKTAGQEIMLAMIPVLDDFERALKAMESANDVASVKEGIELVSHKFKNTLMHKGLKPMESIGQPFNADLHEAITNIPAPTEDMKDKVIDEVEKGYYLGDKVIRYAKVVVGA